MYIHTTYIIYIYTLYTLYTYIYIHIYIYIYIYATRLLSTSLGLLIRVFGMHGLGIETCMDESLGHRYLSLAALQGFGLADRG